MKTRDPDSKQVKVTVKLETPESQEALEEVLEVYSKNKTIKLTVNTVSKKLLPFDIVIEIIIALAAQLIYDSVQRLAKDLSAKKIKYQLDPEARQTIAESLLVKNGVEGHKLKERVDMQDSSEYTYLDKKGKKYLITVASNGLCRYRVA